MTDFEDFKHSYAYNDQFKKRVAYFSMEFALHQPLKIYSGGLGFLAGSHMRSAYDLKQNLVGVGILWKKGYYDQVRSGDQSMDVLFQEKHYGFLEDTNIVFEISVNNHPVKVKAYYLAPEVFETAPMFLLSTDVAENDYLAQSITHKLYDADLAAKIAASIVLGIGGAKFLDIIGYGPSIYHLNEAHALPLAFYLQTKYGDLAEVKKRMVFTTHTPEEAGNEKNDIYLLKKMGYFNGMSIEEVKKLTGTQGDIMDHTLVALRMAKLSNGVSELHGIVARSMWEKYDGIAPIIHITNSQNKRYWADPELYAALEANNDDALIERKRVLKEKMFERVADQSGVLLDPNVLTIVWARRFAGYKRADLITYDEDRFHELMQNKDRPVQIIWAGKPYPMDFNGISQFNKLVHLSKSYKNAAVLVGYELSLSRALKRGSDLWLNNPRVPREASGTSGMTAAMNAAVNFSTNDGWIPEFAKSGINSFVVPVPGEHLSVHDVDQLDHKNIMDMLENVIIPMYYKKPADWLSIVKKSMQDVLPFFDSDRMATEYYDKLYNA